MTRNAVRNLEQTVKQVPFRSRETSRFCERDVAAAGDKRFFPEARMCFSGEPLNLNLSAIRNGRRHSTVSSR
jgi:hypothetical protein